MDNKTAYWMRKYCKMICEAEKFNCPLVVTLNLQKSAKHFIKSLNLPLVRRNVLCFMTAEVFFCIVNLLVCGILIMTLFDNLTSFVNIVEVKISLALPSLFHVKLDRFVIHLRHEESRLHFVLFVLQVSRVYHIFFLVLVC